MMSFNQVKELLFTLCLIFLSIGSSIGQLEVDSLKQEAEHFIHPSVVNGDLGCIQPPSKFEPSELFNGYIRKDISSTIVISEVKELNYIQIADGYTDVFIESQGMQLLTKETFISDNEVKGTLFKLSFNVKDVEITRYMLFAGTLDKTLWINVSYPTKFEELLDAELKRTLQSLKL